MRNRVRQAPLMQGMDPLHAWSVVFDPESGSPTGVRADLARGMVAEVAVGDEKVRNDFDHISIFNRPIFNATFDEDTRTWYDFVERGEEGFSLTPSEVGREVIYRCTPFWYQLELTPEGALSRVSVSDRALEGYRLAPMFTDGTKPVYRPAFEMGYDSKERLVHSRAGLSLYEGASYNITAMARSRSAAARPERAADWFSDYLLLLVEFATCNLQGVMHGRVGNTLALFDAHAENAAFPTGLYSKTEPSFSVGDKVTVYMNYSWGGAWTRYGDYVVNEIVYQAGAGYRLTLKGLTASALFEEVDTAFCCLAYAKTGEAISAVTVASSGRASDSPTAPIVWRGKENPWGNISSLLHDITVECQRDGSVLYRRGASSSSGEEDDTSGAVFYPFFTEETSFVKHVKLNEEGDFLYPIAWESTAPDRYFATRNTQHELDFDQRTGAVMTVGGDCGAGVGTNHAAIDVISTSENCARFHRIGGRLIFEEA